ncbi:MAG: chorismate synthase [Acholeplasmataceae bacterium]|nr:chorismate synthase [Acholeplasmataceae bacterium]
MSSIFGDRIKMTIFGESHGPAIGLVIDGLPAGVELNLDTINLEMARRAPGRSELSTARKEKDTYIIESGMFSGKTTGMPLCALIPNEDQHSKDYSILKNVMRPGHADYSGWIKYKGFNDYRGGGTFSGRLTAPLVFMGAVAKQILAARDIFIGAQITSVGGVEGTDFNPLGETAEVLLGLAKKNLPVLCSAYADAMISAIMAAKKGKDSVGGTVECMAIGVPAGLGEPYFDSVESRLAHVLFSVPAVKGVEFGKGFGFSTMLGSQANDAMYMSENTVKTKTNNNGGILGGITNGMPLLFKVGIKPTPSIALTQNTVDVSKGCNTTLEINGRHDPCIVQRAVPVIEAVTTWTILDLLLAANRS